MEKSAASDDVRFDSALAGGRIHEEGIEKVNGFVNGFVISAPIVSFAALLGAVFGKKTARHQKTSTLPCREAKQYEARHHKARHYKKVGLSAFATAMLCMGVAAQAATITVNSAVDALTDSDKCTLRGAVSSVNAGSNQNNCVAVVSPDAYGSNDTITFDTTVFSAATTIDVTASGEIAISKNLTIEGLLDGDGAPLITLDGNSANRILSTSGAVLAVSGLAFQKGSAVSGNGGAIYANGAVTVSDSTFEDNHARTGGAIYANGAVTVSNSTFENNHAHYSNGGAIYVDSVSATVIVRNSTFENNQADGDGGAIDATTAHVSNSTFNENQAGSNGGAISASTANVSNSAFKGNQGVDHYSTGGAIIASNTTNVSNSTFENNQAGIGGGYYGGGAIFAYATANVSNSTFNENQAGNDGGAIYAYDIANISDSAFKSNQVGYEGGAILAVTANVSNSTFEGNRAGYRGGAIRALATLEASHLTLLDNSAARKGAAICYGGSGNARIDNSLILSSVALVGATALCSGAITGSYNIKWVHGADTTSCNGVNNVSGGSGAIGAIVETTLADNGGPTPTLALPAGSPAIGAADPGGATSRMLDIDFAQTPPTVTWVDATLDQRGVTRVTTAAERSLGAIEYKAPPTPTTNGAATVPVLPAPLVLLLVLGLAVVGIGFRKRKMTKTGFF
ncbi:MAG: hypothetical protein LBS40_06150 [Burkholderiales bacterium]|jgi:predicted outer membrane repeat protein|nr:hypothetical protein [Burkholderiales bacterium]